ncbi:MAG: efflux RND transporter periplasmic adaptor subunit, partial [Patescibacteria group bacterium]|nr:efflux RND transporter periplasmic adaptor subunit [Patescibacteria group bacterium]
PFPGFGDADAGRVVPERMPRARSARRVYSREVREPDNFPSNGLIVAMNAMNQHRLMIWIAALLTTLLFGAAMGWFGVQRYYGTRLADAGFLQDRLKAVAGNANPGESPEQVPMLVRMGAAELKSVHPTRRLVGRLMEVRKVTLQSEVTGKVIAMPVDEGTAVVAGETLIAQIDDVWARLAKDQIAAEIASIRAKLTFEETELEKYRQLFTKKVATESEVEQRQAMVDQYTADIEEAHARLNEAEERIARLMIYAPFDGTVVAKRAELGQLLVPGTPIVDIISRGRIDARLMVPESCIERIRVGDSLPVRVDPLDEEFAGEVVLLVPYGPTASRTFPVRVSLDDQQGRLKAGMSVSTYVTTADTVDGLVVPRDAVLVRPDTATVWVAIPAAAGEPMTAHPVPVTVTAQMRHEYAVAPETVEGEALLGDGSQVIVEGAERLVPGMKVRTAAFDIDDKIDPNASRQF